MFDTLRATFLLLSLLPYLEFCGMPHQARLTSVRAFLIIGVWCQAIPWKLEPVLRVWYFKGHIPVIESFAISRVLRDATSGQAYLRSCVFDHWGLVPGNPMEVGTSAAGNPMEAGTSAAGNPMEAGTSAAGLVFQIRRRKGLKVEISSLSEFEDEEDP
ncbi:hypothetical protein COLO4_14072 [Corchorus olitorius]|uniref:Elongation factor EFG domain-containing protein n=1 Tax=Corchorus olitorius TaxID=93759 RepID=A0A1R3JTJ6_9ROSI|nr:hypothetical protein COLO4_14072 [Corchorus olitorius]